MPNGGGGAMATAAEREMSPGARALLEEGGTKARLGQQLVSAPTTLRRLVDPQPSYESPRRQNWRDSRSGQGPAASCSPTA